MQGADLNRCKARWSFYKNGLNKFTPLPQKPATSGRMQQDTNPLNK